VRSPEVVELSAEMELLDSKGNRLAAAVANRKGDKNLQQGEQITWAHLQAISDYWAKNFRQRLDELKAGKRWIEPTLCRLPGEAAGSGCSCSLGSL
jgi:hypothetical protein